MILLLLLACVGEPVGGDDAAPDADTDTDTDTVPTDRDEDGFLSDTDCDDDDPAVFPGAEEVWNDVDDNCDGDADADGEWEGTVDLDAFAMDGSESYVFSLHCPFEGSRTRGVVEFEIGCAPNPDDDDARRLVGNRIVVTTELLEDVGEQRYAGTVLFTSTNGWDRQGSGAIQWWGFDEAAVGVDLIDAPINVSGGGTITPD